MRDPVTVLVALLMAPLSALQAVDLQKPLRIESGLVRGSMNGTGDVVSFNMTEGQAFSQNLSLPFLLRPVVLPREKGAMAG